MPSLLSTIPTSGSLSLIHICQRRRPNRSLIECGARFQCFELRQIVREDDPRIVLALEAAELFHAFLEAQTVIDDAGSDGGRPVVLGGVDCVAGEDHRLVFQMHHQPQHCRSVTGQLNGLCLLYTSRCV